MLSVPDLAAALLMIERFAKGKIINYVLPSLSFQPPTSAVDRQDGPDVAGLLPQVEQPPQQPPRRLRPPAPGMIHSWNHLWS